MKKQTLGMMITSLRKEKGLTQLELANMMGVTDKAVSKWERDLSCPDVNSIPKLAQIFGVSVDELMQVKTESRENTAKREYSKLIELILKGIALAMGIAVVVMSLLSEIDVNSGLTMLGIGLMCMAISQFHSKDEG